MIKYILIMLGVGVVGSYGVMRLTPTPSLLQQFSSKSGAPSGIYHYYQTYNSDNTHNTGSNGRQIRSSWGRTYYSQGGGGGGGK